MNIDDLAKLMKKRESFICVFEKLTKKTHKLGLVCTQYTATCELPNELYLKCEALVLNYIREQINEIEKQIQGEMK